MVEEKFSDAERWRLVNLVIGAMPIDRADPELIYILTKLIGTDTVLVAQRAYHSRGAVNG